MFQLARDELLKFQNGTSSWGGSPAMPYAFTEQGVSMLSAVLRSQVAIQVSISIMDAFVMMRNYLTTTATVSAELSEIRAKLELLERNDESILESVNDMSESTREEIDTLYEAIGELSLKVLEPPKRPRKPIGYRTSRDEE
jgi:hypothetical protein